MAVIKIIATSDGMMFPGDVYLAAYDVDAERQPAIKSGNDIVVSGHICGSATLTIIPEKALRFPDKASAMDAWRTISSKKPYRPDGKPNRPLTAFTVQIE